MCAGVCLCVKINNVLQCARLGGFEVNAECVPSITEGRMRKFFTGWASLTSSTQTSNIYLCFWFAFPLKKEWEITSCSPLIQNILDIMLHIIYTVFGVWCSMKCLASADTWKLPCWSSVLQPASCEFILIFSLMIFVTEHFSISSSN